MTYRSGFRTPLFAAILSSILVGAVLFGTSVLPTTASAQTKRNKWRLETKVLRDSTRFAMTIESGAKPTTGKTFKAKIHVTPGKGWHVWSSQMSAAGGLVPMTIRVPDTIAKYFAITTIKEVGKPLVIFDSNFMVNTMGYHEPFDIVLTVKALTTPPAPVPFSVWLNFQTCDENMCLPPRTFAVPMSVFGEQPIQISVAKGKADTAIDPTWPKLERSQHSSLLLKHQQNGTSSFRSIAEAKLNHMA